jgi:peroxiredoxin
MSIPRFEAGAPFPDLAWPLVEGGDLVPAGRKGWRMLVIYRGKHCGLCRKYLAELESLRGKFSGAGIDVFALSADPREKARAQVEEGGLGFPVAFGLREPEMRTLGLYVSPPQPDDGVTWPFAEPAVFVINPDSRVQVVNVANAPFSRPDLETMLEGIVDARKQHAPVHGTAGQQRA